MLFEDNEIPFQCIGGYPLPLRGKNKNCYFLQRVSLLHWDVQAEEGQKVLAFIVFHSYTLKLQDLSMRQLGKEGGFGI